MMCHSELPVLSAAEGSVAACIVGIEMLENVSGSVPQGERMETGGWPTDLNALLPGLAVRHCPRPGLPGCP